MSQQAHTNRQAEISASFFSNLEGLAMPLDLGSTQLDLDETWCDMEDDEEDDEDDRPTVKRVAAPKEFVGSIEAVLQHAKRGSDGAFAQKRSVAPPAPCVSQPGVSFADLAAPRMPQARSMQPDLCAPHRAQPVASQPRPKPVLPPMPSQPRSLIQPEMKTYCDTPESIVQNPVYPKHKLGGFEGLIPKAKEASPEVLQATRGMPALAPQPMPVSLEETSCLEDQPEDQSARHILSVEAFVRIAKQATGRARCYLQELLLEGYQQEVMTYLQCLRGSGGNGPQVSRELLEGLM